jgi:hypothetical protein
MLIIRYFNRLYSTLIYQSWINRTKIAAVQTHVHSYTEARATLKNKNAKFVAIRC